MSMKPPERPPCTSRLSGFYRLPPEERIALLARTQMLSEESLRYLKQGGHLTIALADRLSENVVACHSLPFSVATNFLVNDRDVLIPMAVEEPSIVAAASNAARWVRETGGFRGTASASIMTTQVQLDEVPNPHVAIELVLARRDEVMAVGNAAIHRMVARGGGCRDIQARVLDAEEGVVCFYLHVDVGNAMGANIVDSVAEAVAPLIGDWIGGRIGLRILTNLPLRRMVRVEASVLPEAIGGLEAAQGIVRASRFAELDVFRAVTHNKGIMNGIDAAATAFGQDWRAIEAAAHAYASFTGPYKPLAVWRLRDQLLQGVIEMPMAVGTAGGLMSVHPGVKVAFEIAQIADARTLAVVMASAGLASNLAALKALSGEGIQKGHMKLHHRKKALAEELEGNK